MACVGHVAQDCLDLSRTRAQYICMVRPILSSIGFFGFKDFGIEPCRLKPWTAWG